ncbi:kxDL motif-containing protein CG10681-like isoform X2 [Centruroides sculpturatus]|uniref:kxDL motif-containing protein CG10681-like isoform X1 n=1 Tax=Centruroides sculpturatus TaxID=218467 RepID=UPI000C6E61F7|nr:kxDL motif-containing protein CG10681-like isoform X1 [Centruroides sculpturatus]XP_023228119.1 kxDL motif-containing protein CG10681-like isoform X2 [Centruroides sculpturatus]
MSHYGSQEYSGAILPAPVAFIQTLSHQVNEHDVETLIQAQQQMLLRFEKTNEMLINCNALSASRFEVASREIKRHIQLLTEMKKDLDSVFRRIRFLKMKLSQQYPTAFSACNNIFNVLDEEEEQDEKETGVSKKSQISNAIESTNPPSSSEDSQGSSSSFITSPCTSDDTT